MAYIPWESNDIHTYIHTYIYICNCKIKILSMFFTWDNCFALMNIWCIISFFPFFLPLNFFNWSIFALQNFVVSVIHQQESAICTPMPPPSLNSLPAPSPSHPSRLSQSPCLSSLSHIANSYWLSILHMVM